MLNAIADHLDDWIEVLPARVAEEIRLKFYKEDLTPVVLIAVAQGISHPTYCVRHALQVLGYCNDPRLWSLDQWLLTEISHEHFTFAGAYLARLLQCSKRLLAANIHTQEAHDTCTWRLDDVRCRIEALSARSTRLSLLCAMALEQSMLAGLFEGHSEPASCNRLLHPTHL